MLTDDDLRQLAERGIEPADARRQLELLRKPPRPAQLCRPCILGDGIRQLPTAEHPRLLAAHARAVASGRFSKMVPASGAASRMFHSLQVLRSHLEAGETPPSTVAADGSRFFAALRRFPFASDLLLDECNLEDRDVRRALLHRLLDPTRLGLAERPKALIPFHRTADGARTPFEEHLLEGAPYLRDRSGTIRVHLTVSPQHQEAFEELLAVRRPTLEAKVGTLEVTFSTQDPSTDTLAIDLEGRPYRDGEGRLLLRPGGHGALLGNLQRLGGDLVHVKNVDNVLPETRQAEMQLWKRLLGGLLCELQERVFSALEALVAPPPGVDELAAASDLATGIGCPEAISWGDLDEDERRRRLVEALDRPLRVCGVVENAGEPGGGPFWVAGPGKEERGQIVEAAQMDPSDPHQQEIRAAATHFNPVDLVCGLRDRTGRPYPLDRFVDHDAVFISRKSQDGKALFALERPGLWNGAMARWNTVFVEVPATTFAPVKTVFDLLRPEHQPRSGGSTGTSDRRPSAS